MKALRWLAWFPWLVLACAEPPSAVDVSKEAAHQACLVAADFAAREKAHELCKGFTWDECAPEKRIDVDAFHEEEMSKCH